MFSHRYNNRCWNWQEGVSSSQRVLECENRTESFFFPLLLYKDLSDIILHPL